MTDVNKNFFKKNLWFFIPAIILIGLTVFFVIKTNKEQNRFDYESSITPIPTATIYSIDLTHDPSIPTSEPEPTALLLANGSTGETVKELQQKLIELGYLTDVADGHFGPKTQNAVYMFQEQNGLIVDGMVGDNTWNILFSNKAMPFQPAPTVNLTEILNDLEMPFLVNKENPVSENFVPDGLVKIADVDQNKVLILKSQEVQGVFDAVEALICMINDAESQGIKPWQVNEGYRSYSDQKIIFDEYVERYIKNNGLSRADAISATKLTVADPGCSEHHTGLAFDIAVPNTSSFADTAQYAWLYRHCHEYGFVIRYTDEKTEITGFLGEEWHIRYVGTQHSLKMHELDMCLEEYIDYLKAEASK